MRLSNAIRSAMAYTGTRNSDICSSLGLAPACVTNRISRESITDNTLDILSSFGYKVALVPSDCPLPDGSVVVER